MSSRRQPAATRGRPPRPFYAADLAYVHDAGFRGFAQAAAPGVLRRLRHACRPGERVVELGCGTGALTEFLVRAGYRPLGVDASAAMLRHARRRLPGTAFRLASYCDFVPPRCAAIVAVGECLNYLTDGRRRHEATLRRWFRRAAASLPPGGLLLFDFLLPWAGRPRRRSVERSGSDWLVLVAVGEDRHRRVLTRRITTIRRVGGVQRLAFEVHRQALLPRADLRRMLESAGFAVRFLSGYGRRRLPPGQAVVEAVRTVYTELCSSM